LGSESCPVGVQKECATLHTSTQLHNCTWWVLQGLPRISILGWEGLGIRLLVGCVWLAKQYRFSITVVWALMAVATIHGQADTVTGCKIRNLKWSAIFPILDWPCGQSECTMLKFRLAIFEKWLEIGQWPAVILHSVVMSMLAGIWFTTHIPCTSSCLGVKKCVSGLYWCTYGCMWLTMGWVTKPFDDVKR